MNIMRRGKRILTILLSLALILTMAIPVAFADDTAPVGDAETVQDEGVDTVEAPAADSAQVIDEAAEEELVQEEVDADQEAVTVEEISLDEEEIGQSKAKLAANNINRKILICGLDNGGRADLIIILCFTSENEAKIFSVDRDTYMQLNKSHKYTIEGKARDYFKCNKAAELGGMNVLIEELNRHLDLNIKDYIGVDWACAAALIDAMNNNAKTDNDKFKVNVEKDMLEWINSSSIPGYPQANGKIKSAGTQVLNGWQAVQYLRVRKYDDGDARVRESRNLDVFLKLYKMARNWDSAKKEIIYNAISGRIKTNMGVPEIKSLIDQFGKVSVVRPKAAQYPYQYKIYWDKWADFYYWVPTTLEANTLKLHREVLGQSTYTVGKNSEVKKLSNAIAKQIKKKTILAKKPKVPSVAKATVTVGTSAYTGKAVTPSITVKLKKKKLKATYYSVTYKNNVNIGKASVTIAGRCGYGGTKTVTFDIKPAGTYLTGVTAGSKSFTTTWAAQTAKMPSKTVDGYQIQYGLKKNFKKAKTMTISGYTNTTATVGKLKAKKKYYVRVRTYVGSGKSAVYSDWSKAKTVKPTK